jgi:transcriptional regulator with XRE-family HTH domain
MIKPFQLRAARSVTGITVREVGLYLGVSRTTVSNWEQQNAFSDMYSKTANLKSLFFFFKQHNIIFPSFSSIELNTKSEYKNTPHLTRFQLRASRAALNLTQHNLADLSGVPREIINYLEKHKNEMFLNETNKNFNDIEIRKFFETNNIEFIKNYSISLNNDITKN